MLSRPCRNESLSLDRCSCHGNSDHVTQKIEHTLHTSSGRLTCWVDTFLKNLYPWIDVVAKVTQWPCDENRTYLAINRTYLAYIFWKTNMLSRHFLKESLSLDWCSCHGNSSDSLQLAFTGLWKKIQCILAVSYITVTVNAISKKEQYVIICITSLLCITSCVQFIVRTKRNTALKNHCIYLNISAHASTFKWLNAIFRQCQSKIEIWIIRISNVSAIMLKLILWNLDRVIMG